MKRRILPSITTAGKAKALWPSFLIELETLQIKECALFLTGLNFEEREELYAKLSTIVRRTGIKIPFVHARSDMKKEEYYFLIDFFGAQKFNLHPTKEMPLIEPLPLKLRQLIYIENTANILNSSDLRGFAGMCTDISHIEDYRRQNQDRAWNSMINLVNRFPIGVSHISAISRQPYVFKDGRITYAPHRVESLSDLSYLRSYPRHFFGEFIALELENSIEEQLAFKNHIEKNIWRVVPEKSYILQPTWQASVAV